MTKAKIHKLDDETSLSNESLSVSVKMESTSPCRFSIYPAIPDRYIDYKETFTLSFRGHIIYVPWIIPSQNRIVPPYAKQNVLL